MSSEPNLLQLAVQLAAAHISKNTISLEEIPNVLNFIYKKLQDSSYSQSKRALLALKPAVPISESVQDNYIICLEDGKKLQMLKRHLFTVYNMTPEQYRERWGLSPDYPMVSPGYAKRRSRIARDTGLGYTGNRKKHLSLVVEQGGDAGVIVKAV